MDIYNKKVLYIYIYIKHYNAMIIIQYTLNYSSTRVQCAKLINITIMFALKCVLISAMS